MLRFVEIGFAPLLKSAYPDETHFVDTRFSWEDGRGHHPADKSVLTRLRILISAVKDVLSIPVSTAIELVVVRSRGAENSFRFGFGYLLKKLLGWSLHQLAIHLASKHRCKLAVVDRTDEATIHPNDLRILKRCDVYFKRELPWSVWSSMELLKPRRICIGTASGITALQLLAEKLLPISLGVEDHILNVETSVCAPKKEFDIFYMGRSYGMERRCLVERAIIDCEKAGFKVFRRELPLSREEFLRVIRVSKIAISPGGVGWDCFRHYEIPACGTALMIERPSHRIYAFPQENVEAISYDPHLQLLPMLQKWLNSPADLAALATAGRHWVATHHTYSALGRYISEVGTNTR